jgi:hypothetical protein
MVDIRDIPINTIIFLERFIKKYKLNKFYKALYNSENIRKLNRINFSLNENASLFLTDLQKEDNKFKIISNELCNKELINEMDNVLKLYIDYNPLHIRINSREILSSWMILNCKSILEDYINKDTILNSSKELIEQITILNNKFDINFDIIKFNKIFINYYDTFIIFKEYDKIQKLNYFIREWKNLEETSILIKSSDKYSEEQKIEVLKIMEINKKNVEKHIKIFTSNYDFNLLKRLIENTHKINKRIIDTYKTILFTELNSNNYDIFINILNEIKKFLLLFNPLKNTEYSEKIDPIFYMNLIQSDSIKIEDLYFFGDYLIKEILKLGSIELENVKLKEWNSTKTLNEKESIKKNISIMLIFVMNIIEEIKLEINDYKLLLDLICFN